MDNANKIACELLVYPNNAKYDEDIRQFQGCPTCILGAEQYRIRTGGSTGKTSR